MATTGQVAMWSIILVGLFNSILFPSIFTLGVAGLGPLTNRGSGVLIASQTDSSLWVVEAAGPRRVVRTRGRPADIGYDARRGLVAVPYIALNRVDVWRVR